MAVYPQLILRLIETCEQAARAGVCREEICGSFLPEKVERLVRNLAAQDFLEWARNDPDYSFYYNEVEHAGLAARPAEAAAMILEAIAMDALE
ncbi:MAG: hypothetical protein HYX74_02610 [Acidobacteria bacterium]|nr:hypothetical protein [Acidobacteriota bacterium]